jgi:hypothetical protein
VFDIGDLEWSIYMLDQLLPEEDAEVEDEDLASSAGVGRQENISGRPPPGSTDGPASSAYLTDQLERLAVLHRQGLLTAEEFRIAKRNLLFPR